jgi:hypothetical protein
MWDRYKYCSIYMISIRSWPSTCTPPFLESCQTSPAGMIGDSVSRFHQPQSTLNFGTGYLTSNSGLRPQDLWRFVARDIYPKLEINRNRQSIGGAKVIYQEHNLKLLRMLAVYSIYLSSNCLYHGVVELGSICCDYGEQTKHNIKRHLGCWKLELSR